MKKTLPLTNHEGEVRELTTEDLSMFKSTEDALPESLQKSLEFKALKRLLRKLQQRLGFLMMFLRLLKQRVMVGKLGLMHHYVNLLSSTQ